MSLSIIDLCTLECCGNGGWHVPREKATWSLSMAHVTDVSHLNLNQTFQIAHLFTTLWDELGRMRGNIATAASGTIMLEPVPRVLSSLKGNDQALIEQSRALSQHKRSKNALRTRLFISYKKGIIILQSVRILGPSSKIAPVGADSLIKQGRVRSCKCCQFKGRMTRQQVIESSLSACCAKPGLETRARGASGSGPASAASSESGHEG